VSPCSFSSRDALQLERYVLSAEKASTNPFSKGTSESFVSGFIIERTAILELLHLNVVFTFLHAVECIRHHPQYRLSLLVIFYLIKDIKAVGRLRYCRTIHNFVRIRLTTATKVNSTLLVGVFSLLSIPLLVNDAMLKDELDDCWWTEAKTTKESLPNGTSGPDNRDGISKVVGGYWMVDGGKWISHGVR
jgi:hypothetical protein